MKKLKSLFKSIGPGFITGASDDDPSGIATYSQTGAQFGYSQAWTSLFSFPFMVAVQEMCGRIGLVTGKGIAAIARDNFPKPVLYAAVILLLCANTINIGADLGAMAAALRLVLPVPFFVALIFFTVLILALEVFVSYPAYAKILKYLALSLFAYVATAFIVHLDWGKALSGTLIPQVSLGKEYIFNIVAILGTTISPYLFFWQADEEVEEEIEARKISSMGKGRPHLSKMDLSHMRIDTFSGMFFSNLVMFFIIIVGASVLGLNGIHNVETADQAASALKPFAGEFASVIFALGIVGTGLLAVPVLSGSAAYAIAESFNWKAGLGLKFKRAHGFYGVITVATLVGLIVNFTPIEPFQMLYYTAIINGVVAPLLLVLLIIIANNKKIMGKYSNSITSNILVTVITTIMSIAALALLFDIFS